MESFLLERLQMAVDLSEGKTPEVVTENIVALAQPGPQTKFLKSKADITIYGGAAGGGKTYALLLEPLKHINVPGFGAVIFRRILPSIKIEGGMWDESQEMYSERFGEPRSGALSWTFPMGTRIRFSGMQYESDKMKYQGSQIALIGFDQLEEFTEGQFFFMLSRNRSMCGVKPYIRAGANPEPNWLAKFLDWWIDDEGYADPKRAGKMRWFVRVGDRIEWGGTKKELILKNPKEKPKSVTFIPASVYDNKILLKKNPEYLANLMALPPVERARLLGDPKRGGNWKIKPSAGLLYNRGWYNIVPAVPKGGVECLYWDLAATAKDYKSGQKPSYTAGVSIRKVEGEYYIRFVFAEQLSPHDVEKNFVNLSNQQARIALFDKTQFMVRWEEEPGSASKRESRRLAQLLDGIDAKGDRVTTDKFIRGRPFASNSEVGNIHLVSAPWVETWLEHMHNQPEIPENDIHDASTGSYNILAGSRIIREVQSFQG